MPAVELATFDPPLARAVEAVLRRQGLPARAEAAAGDWPVLVPVGRRDEAYALLARHMDEVQALASREAFGASPGGREDGPAPPPGAAHTGATRSPVAPPSGDGDDEPPIVMERLRRMGFVALLLAPLLVVTLASTGMPLAYALVVFLLGLVVVAAWRDRADGSDRR